MSSVTTSTIELFTPPFSPSSTFSDFGPRPTRRQGPNGGGLDGNNDGLGGNGNRGGGTSATVYLYTFLGVLLLLLAISATIVARTIMRRRRQRRMMEEAIRNGTWIPPNGKPPKPVMYEATLNAGNEHHDWETCKPFAVSYTQDLPLPTPPPARIWALIKSSSSSPPHGPVAQTIPPGPLRISMFIAMPSPKDEQKAGQIPQIELGTAEVPVLHPPAAADPPSTAKRRAVEEV
ncbi:uncharacterized protein BT62DRAFT_314918 [Guyanagaster necrorhizus]|uniref:Uncharacterized protein n=1 Tax=Guyanagaster necrorhizus TaxID=856835 RepID=A0A9P7VNM4_9AGAR|nr:uncharacterized protein BT62DRAFT_314918 [Guyanagaster necrorhizus MCA 3950]KAG7443787.1 hypothetical protein BT62DRAFT_314918 [Guyanagaster necrorhizus MCA 3950]